MLGAWTVWPPGRGEGGMGSRDHREQGWKGCLWGLGAQVWEDPGRGVGVDTKSKEGVGGL